MTTPTDAEARELVKRLREWAGSSDGRSAAWNGLEVVQLVRDAADLIDSLLSRPSREEVMEACAKIADSMRLGEGGMLSGTGRWAVHEGACIEIAAAIRALAKPSPEKQG